MTTFTKEHLLNYIQVFEEKLAMAKVDADKASEVVKEIQACLLDAREKLESVMQEETSDPPSIGGNPFKLTFTDDWAGSKTQKYE